MMRHMMSRQSKRRRSMASKVSVGAVWRWPLTETGSSNRLDAIGVYGGGTLVPGKSLGGSADGITFDGTAASYLDSTDPAAWRTTVESLRLREHFSISFFWNPSSLATKQDLLGWWSETGNQRAWRVRQLDTTGQTAVVLSTDGVTTGARSFGDAVVGVRRHYAVTYDDSGDVALYVDGVLVTRWTYGGMVHQSTAAPRLGDTAQSSYSPCQGVLGDVRVWNRCLFGDEITAIAAGAA